MVASEVKEQRMLSDEKILEQVWTKPPMDKTLANKVFVVMKMYKERWTPRLISELDKFLGLLTGV